MIVFVLDFINKIYLVFKNGRIYGLKTNLVGFSAKVVPKMIPFINQDKEDCI